MIGKKGHRVPGPKTKEQQIRTLERKSDVPKDSDPTPAAEAAPRPMNRKARQSEFPISKGGMSQESQHHKPAKP